MLNYVCPICGKPSKLNIFSNPREDMLCGDCVKDLKSGKLTKQKVWGAVDKKINPKTLNTKNIDDIFLYAKAKKIKIATIKNQRKCLEPVLASLQIKENIVDIIETDVPASVGSSIYLLSDNNMLYRCDEECVPQEGIFSEPNYYYYNFKTSLNGFKREDCVFNTYKLNTYPYTAYDAVVYKEVGILVKEGYGEKVIKQLESHAKKYAQKVEAPKVTVEVVTKEKPKKQSKSKIEEIRALYEDGIITKEEMLDLIKNSK